ncbi:uncharacterized protein VTP21DRAFT_356 [Calcarisporiella thermophila]|uniref:uncharacterized protein n=1 Tax=Calcarisporiella thermophila TaxID=911321 RepID=UPI003741F219
MDNFTNDIIFGPAVITFIIVFITAALYNMLFRTNLRFEERHCFITGGSQGLGLGLALQLSKRGANVTIVSRSVENLKAALAQIEAVKISNDQKFAYISADVTKKEEVARAFDEAIEKHDGHVPEFVACCAGLSIPGLFIEQSLEIHEKQMQLNYFGTLYTVHEAVKRMVESDIKGKIVVTTSILGFLSFIGYSSYSPTKYAIRGLADSLRNELKMFGISIHTFFPGNIDSPGFENENKTKPDITKKLEGASSPMNPEACAKCLINGIEKNHVHITSDFIGEISRIGAGSSAIPNNYLIELFAKPILWSVFFIVNLFYDMDVRKFGKNYNK